MDVTPEGLVAGVGAARRALADRGPISLRREGDFERVALPSDDGDALRDLLLSEQARVVVEIGLAYGASALAIVEALATGGGDGKRHLIIDAFQDTFDDVGWNALVGAGLGEMCQLLRERSQVALPALVAEGFVADAAFVDGSHAFHNVFVDLFYLRELVRPGGLIILDDCNWPSVATVAHYFEINTGWQREPVGGETRIRAYRLPPDSIEPSFACFRPFGLDATTQ
jgi:predicted O-methyltransferase YrrM